MANRTVYVSEETNMPEQDDKHRKAYEHGRKRAETEAQFVHVRGGLGISLCFRTVGGVLPREVAQATCPHCIRIVARVAGGKA